MIDVAWPECPDTFTDACVSGNFHAKTYDEMVDDPVRLPTG